MSEDTFHEDVHRIGYGYLLNIICLIGVAGNVLVLMVLLKKRDKGPLKTAQHYLILMTLADITVLIFAVARYRSYAIFLNDHQLERNVFCVDPYVQVYVEPFYFIALGTSSYVTVFLTIDRYLAIRYPLLCIKTTFSPTVAYVQAATCLQLMVSLTCPLWLSYTVQEFHYLNKTIVAAKLTDFGKESMYECRFHQFVIPMIWYVIPWCVMAVLNTMLYAEVHKSSHACHQLTRGSTPSKRLSTVVLYIVLVHMMCSFPRCMVAVYNMVHAREGHVGSGSGGHCAPGIRSRFYTTISVGSNILNVFNSCINIAIYCGLGAKFRQELKAFFTSRCTRNRVTPITFMAAISTETKAPASGVKGGVP